MNNLQSTADLPFDALADAMKTALEGLSMIGYVDVDLVGQIDSEEDRTFAVTFNDPYLGDVELLSNDTSQLRGIGVSKITKGSLTQTPSFDFPRSCTT